MGAPSEEPPEEAPETAPAEPADIPEAAGDGPESADPGDWEPTRVMEPVMNMSPVKTVPNPALFYP